MVRIHKNFASIHKASLFSIFLAANHIIFGDFAAKFKSSYSQDALTLERICCKLTYKCKLPLIRNDRKVIARHFA